MLGDTTIRNPKTEMIKQKGMKIMFWLRDESARGPKNVEPIIHIRKKKEAGMPSLNLSSHMRAHSETINDPLPSTHSHRLPSISHKEDFFVHHFYLLIDVESCNVTLSMKSGI